MKKTKLFFLLQLMMATTWQLSAQTPGGCLQDPPPNNSITYDSLWRPQNPAAACGDLSYFIDTSTNLTFRVNVHFFRPTVGSFWYNGPRDVYKNATAADADSMIKYVNQRMSSMHAPDKLATPPVGSNYTDSHIRYSLQGVYFHTNDSAFKSPYGWTNWAHTRYAVNPNSEINIYFTADSTKNGAGYGTYGYIVMSDFGWTPTLWCYTCFNKVFIGTMAHELGHTAGLLGHTDSFTAFGTNVQSNQYYPSASNDYFHESVGPCWGNVNSVSQGGCASNNIMGHNNDRTYLSPNQIGSFYYGVYAGINTKFAVSTLPTNRCVYDSSKTLNITTSTTWTHPVVTNGDIVVQPGVLLTIKCVVHFSPGSRLLIKPTAKVVIDGGTLFTKCGFWQGVQVQGNKNAGQLITRGSSMPVNQGMLSMINGGAIQNAQVGATTIEKWSSGAQDWNKTGGIIQATGANFQGNIKDVEFLWYQNMNSISWFTNCLFSGQNQPSGGWGDSRVSLYGIKNVSFFGCDFNANTCCAGSLRDNGIDAADAGFIVDSTSAGKDCKFNSFLYGINAQNATLLNDPITVNSAEFHVNYNGSIYLSKANYATITNNWFKQWYAFSTQTNPDYGVYMNECTGYSIRKNTLNGPNIANNGWHYGICINKSGTGNNSVYNNYYSKLKYSLISQEENQGTNGNTGLLMNCNEFSNCTNNITVSGTFNNPNGNGVLKIQGSFSNPALYVRNRYNAPACGTENLYGISNVGYQLYHPSFTGAPYQPTPQQTCSDSTEIRVYQLTGTYSSSYCPATCTGCRTISEVEQSIRGKKLALEALRGTSNSEQKKAFEYELAFENAQLGILSNDRIRTFLNDTSLKNPLDSVIAELKQKRNPDYKKQLAAVYAQKGDIQRAHDYLDSAKADEPTNFDMYDIGNEMISARNNPPGYIAALKTNTQLKNKLLTMANNPLSAGFGQARAFLNQAFGTKFNEHWVLPASGANRETRGIGDETLVVFPNPAGNVINIAYTLSESDQASIMLSDVSGRTIKTAKLKAGSDIHTLEVSDLNNGVYFLTLHKTGSIVATTKVIIIK